MSNIRKLKIEIIITELKEVLRDATMNTASFDEGLENKDTRFIKETTKLWRESWLISPLNRIIGQLEFEMNRNPRDKE